MITENLLASPSFHHGKFWVQNVKHGMLSLSAMPNTAAAAHLKHGELTKQGDRGMHAAALPHKPQRILCIIQRPAQGIAC